tara:strand:- start:7182 stop:7487 length:306 start_codon:yes stop_codon:yes gene_type:complete
MSEEDYCPERDNDYDEFEEDMKKHKDIKKNEMIKKQLSILKNIFEDGGLRTENILEIQMILKLIEECESDDGLKLQMGKCLEMIINLANQYLNFLHENGSI